MSISNSTYQPASPTSGVSARGPIDRKELVRRHNVRQQALDPRSPVSVGNGEFAFTMDLTGLQSLPDSYPVGARDELPPGTLLGTQAQWGWHATPPAQAYELSGSTVLYDSPRGPVPYVDMAGGIVNDRETGTSPAETWLRANPHRLDLGRIGFRLVVVVVAALNLVLDFDFIETGVEKGAPKYMEWYGAFGLIVTLVWLYIEFLRLLSKLQSR